MWSVHEYGGEGSLGEGGGLEKNVTFTKKYYVDVLYRGIKWCKPEVLLLKKIGIFLKIIFSVTAYGFRIFFGFLGGIFIGAFSGRILPGFFLGGFFPVGLFSGRDLSRRFFQGGFFRGFFWEGSFQVFSGGLIPSTCFRLTFVRILYLRKKPPTHLWHWLLLVAYNFMWQFWTAFLILLQMWFLIMLLVYIISHMYMYI